MVTEVSVECAAPAVALTFTVPWCRRQRRRGDALGVRLDGLRRERARLFAVNVTVVFGSAVNTPSSTLAVIVAVPPFGPTPGFADSSIVAGSPAFGSTVTGAVGASTPQPTARKARDTAVRKRMDTSGMWATDQYNVSARSSEPTGAKPLHAILQLREIARKFHVKRRPPEPKATGSSPVGRTSFPSKSGRTCPVRPDGSALAGRRNLTTSTLHRRLAASPTRPPSTAPRRRRPGVPESRPSRSARLLDVGVAHQILDEQHDSCSSGRPRSRRCAASVRTA
jgi:hypothetical protein